MFIAELLFLYGEFWDDRGGFSPLGDVVMAMFVGAAATFVWLIIWIVTAVRKRKEIDHD